jgi:hypothetical protein
MWRDQQFRQRLQKKAPRRNRQVPVGGQEKQMDTSKKQFIVSSLTPNR